MRKFTIAICVFLLVASSTVLGKKGKGSKKRRNSDVIVLNGKSFGEQVIDGSDNWIIKFYAPWCGHCKKLAPIWEKVATSLKGKVKVAKVDCTKETTLCNSYDVSGYPFLSMFSTDDDSHWHEEFKGARNQQSIETWAMTGVVETAEDIVEDDLVVEEEDEEINLDETPAPKKASEKDEKDEDEEDEEEE